jgi:hypothetical protein
MPSHKEFKMTTYTYCFDIDETICSSQDLDYSTAIPIEGRIEKINLLFDSGHIIKLFTARGSKSGIDFEELTIAQLKIWGLKYHEIKFGKPFADFYIDDKGINAIDFDWS